MFISLGNMCKYKIRAYATRISSIQLLFMNLSVVEVMNENTFSRLFPFVSKIDEVKPLQFRFK